MTPNAETGADKYQRRTHFVKLTRQLRKIADTTHRNQAVAQGQLALFQDKIRDLLDAQGLYVDLRHQYMAYAQALDKSQRTMDFMVDLIREHGILRDRFERRGLDPTVLDAIDQLVIYRTRDR